MSQLQCVSPPREIRIPIDRLTFCISELGALIFRRRRIFLRKFVKEIINFWLKIAFVEYKTQNFSPAARNKIFLIYNHSHDWNNNLLWGSLTPTTLVQSTIKYTTYRNSSVAGRYGSPMLFPGTKMSSWSRVWPRGPGNIIIIIKFVLHNDESTLSCLWEV